MTKEVRSVDPTRSGPGKQFSERLDGSGTTAKDYGREIASAQVRESERNQISRPRAYRREKIASGLEQSRAFENKIPPLRFCVQFLVMMGGNRSRVTEPYV